MSRRLLHFANVAKQVLIIILLPEASSDAPLGLVGGEGREQFEVPDNTTQPHPPCRKAKAYRSLGFPLTDRALTHAANA